MCQFWYLLIVRCTYLNTFLAFSRRSFEYVPKQAQCRYRCGSWKWLVAELLSFLHNSDEVYTLSLLLKKSGCSNLKFDAVSPSVHVAYISPEA